VLARIRNPPSTLRGSAKLRLATVVATIACALLASCDDSPCVGPTEPIPPFPVKDGSYTLHVAVRSSAELPFGSSPDVRLLVDRTDSTITVTYRKDGNEVREVWRISANSFSLNTERASGRITLR